MTGSIAFALSTPYFAGQLTTMERFRFLLLFFILPVVSSAQQPDTVMVGDKIFEKVEVEAHFPGDANAWRQFLVENIDPLVPVNKKAPAGTYTVVIQFVVDRNGGLSDFRALTNHGYGMEEEVIRKLKRSPAWEPAIQYGRPVKAYRKQPVTFQVLEDDDLKRKGKRKKKN